MSMHKQNRDDDPAIPSHHHQTPENIPYTLTKTHLLPRDNNSKYLLARRLCLLVDWLHPPRNSLFSSSILITISSQVSSLISNAHPQSCAHRVDHPPRCHRQPTSNAAEAARNLPNQARHLQVQPKHFCSRCTIADQRPVEIVQPRHRAAAC